MPPSGVLLQSVVVCVRQLLQLSPSLLVVLWQLNCQHVHEDEARLTTRQFLGLTRGLLVPFIL